MSLSDIAKNAGSKLQDRLSDKAKSALTAGAESLINSKLADTILTTGPKDELLTIDAYGIKDSGILTSLVGKLSGFAKDALESFRDGGKFSNVLSGIIRADGGKIKIDTDQLKDRVLNSLGGSVGLIKGLNTTLSNTLVNGLGLPAEIGGRVDAVIGEVTRSIQTGDITSARTVFNLINQITGNTELAKFYDIEAEASLLNTVFREAIQLGLPDAIDEMVASSKSSKAAEYALRSNVVVALQYSDLNTVDTMINKLGVSRILADTPDAAKNVLAYYRIPDGTAVADYPAEFTKLTSVLNKLNPNWHTYNRNGTQVSDLRVLSGASDDALKILKTSEEYVVPCMIASKYQDIDLVETAKKRYPLAVIR